ncbi:MAG: hypothetical protein NC336_09915 [Clostridium sp.]|nr:hypothetical protein [Clostridium sp.]
MSPTFLRVYDLASGDNIHNVRLDGYFNQLLVADDGRIILSSPTEEDKLFVISDIRR